MYRYCVGIAVGIRVIFGLGATVITPFVVTGLDVGIILLFGLGAFVMTGPVTVIDVPFELAKSNTLAILPKAATRVS